MEACNEIRESAFHCFCYAGADDDDGKRFCLTFCSPPFDT